MSSPMDQRQQRVFDARLAGLAARLADEGIPRETVDRLLAAWDEVAWQRGLMRDTPGWFGHAPAYVREQVAAERGSRSRTGTQGVSDGHLQRDRESFTATRSEA